MRCRVIGERVTSTTELVLDGKIKEAGWVGATRIPDAKVDTTPICPYDYYIIDLVGVDSQDLFPTIQEINAFLGKVNT